MATLKVIATYIWAGLGESIKTAQAILGHSDIERTLNTYMYAIPDSQRRAVDRVAGVLFPDVPKLATRMSLGSLISCDSTS